VRSIVRSIVEGLRFVRGRQAIQGAYLIDIKVPGWADVISAMFRNTII
jgi:hypothetical protein